MDDPASAMDALLDRLITVLSSGGSAGPAGTTSGHAADDMVTAVVTADGHVESLVLDPKLLRTPGTIGPGIAEAVNNAVAAAPPASPAASRTEQLKAIQRESLTLSEQLNTSLVTALERLKPR